MTEKHQYLIEKEEFNKNKFSYTIRFIKKDSFKAMDADERNKRILNICLTLCNKFFNKKLTTTRTRTEKFFQKIEHEEFEYLTFYTTYTIGNDETIHAKTEVRGISCICAKINMFLSEAK